MHTFPCREICSDARTVLEARDLGRLADGGLNGIASANLVNANKVYYYNGLYCILSGRENFSKELDARDAATRSKKGADAVCLGPPL
jgi:hypothetical protein